MFGLLDKLKAAFQREGAGTSKEDAKQRLKFLLIHDQVDLAPAQLDQMKTEILDVISKYVDFDQEGMEFKLDREDGHISLVSMVPVRRVTATAPAVASPAPALSTPVAG